MRRLELIIGVAIFVFTFSVFKISRVHQFTDSHYSMMLSESLLHHGSFALDGYNIPRLTPKQQVGYVSNGEIYHLEIVNGRIYYFFPPGSSLLSTPYVALMNVLGVSATNRDLSYNAVGEAQIEVGLATLLMAGLACIIFYTALLSLPVGWSALLALGITLGTQVWSTASRALWADTWGIFLLGIVVWMLLAHEEGKRKLSPVILATLLSWAYFVRPTYALPIIAVTIYLLVYHRALIARYVVTGLVWLAVFVAYSWHNFGQVLPNYYRASRLDFGSFWTALAGNLVSPSRGLLVFVPLLFFIIYLLARYRRELTQLRLIVLSLCIVVAHLVVVSGFTPWWGGYCYGPRYTTGLVPWFGLLGILAIKARLARRNNFERISRYSPVLELAAGAVLLLGSMTINALGATAHRTWLWNMRPMSVDDHPERVWDWKHPQFLAK